MIVQPPRPQSWISTLIVHVFALLGMHRLQETIARLDGEPPLPHPRSAAFYLARPWSPERLVEMGRWCRYFGIANLVRAASYIPALFALRTAEMWPVYGVALLLFTAHMLMVGLELYRVNLIRLIHRVMTQERFATLSATVAPLPTSVEEPFPAQGYFAIGRLETPEFYRQIGVEFFRKFVLWYTVNTKSPAENGSKKSNNNLETNSPAGVTRFAAKTMTSEIVHLSGGLVLTPVVVALYGLGATVAAGISTFMLIVDLYLVLLQRYHRVRVYRLISERRRAA